MCRRKLKELEESHERLYDALSSLVIHLGWMEEWKAVDPKVWRSDSPREILCYEALKEAKLLMNNMRKSDGPV